jgi:hypothetical protein
MATYDRTITGGGTVGHPSDLPRPYTITSPVYDAVDNTNLAGADIVKLIDLPADTMVIGGSLEVLEASGNEQITLDVGTSLDVDSFVDGVDSDPAAAINYQFTLKAGAVGNLATSADAIQVTVLDGGSSATTALRFRVHAVLCDVSRNPVESATVSTGT